MPRLFHLPSMFFCFHCIQAFHMLKFSFLISILKLSAHWSLTSYWKFQFETFHPFHPLKTWTRLPNHYGKCISLKRLLGAEWKMDHESRTMMEWLEMMVREHIFSAITERPMKGSWRQMLDWHSQKALSERAIDKMNGTALAISDYHRLFMNLMLLRPLFIKMASYYDGSPRCANCFWRRNESTVTSSGLQTSICGLLIPCYTHSEATLSTLGYTIRLNRNALGYIVVFCCVLH